MDTEMDSSGAALSLLYPFEEGFYARLGYAVTSPLLALRVSSRKLLSMQALGSPSLTAVAADGTQAMALYEDVARQTSGRLVRSEIRWLDRFSRENRYWMGVAPNKERLDGYASFSYQTRAGTASLPRGSRAHCTR